MSHPDSLETFGVGSRAEMRRSVLVVGDLVPHTQAWSECTLWVCSVG